MTFLEKHFPWMISLAVAVTGKYFWTRYKVQRLDEKIKEQDKKILTKEDFREIVEDVTGKMATEIKEDIRRIEKVLEKEAEKREKVDRELFAKCDENKDSITDLAIQCAPFIRGAS